MELFEIAGEQFYFDLDRISDFVRIEENDPKNIEELLTKENSTEENETKTNEEEYQGPLIDMTRWDLTKAMIETILNENSVVDEDMGVTMLGKQLSIPFRISFNTLIKHKLIKNK